MADRDRTPRPRGDTTRTYVDPADEPRSAETQQAADRWLNPWPTQDPDGGCSR